MLHRHTFAYLLFATLNACNTWSPHPTSMSSMAVLCAPGRVVWCEQGDPACRAVAVAVRVINDAVPGLMVYAGELPRADLVRLGNDKRADVTVVIRGRGVPAQPAQYEQLPIAFTMVNPDGFTACLQTVPVVIVWPDSGLGQSDWNQVVLHEFLHSLGATHAPNECPFSTVMHPGLATERRVGLSKADVNWLRAVYGR